MTELQEEFMAEVKQRLPKAFFGLAPSNVECHYGSNPADYVLVAVYFLRAFDKSGKPLDVPLTDFSADWQQVALHIAASGREIRLNAGNMDKLAQERIQKAQDAIPPNDPFFAKIAA